MAGMLALPKGKLTPESIRAQLHLTPQQAQQLDRIVAAGMKVMFSKESHGMLLEQLKGPGTIDQKLGQGVAGLIGLLMQESKNSLPPNLLIPAGMVLLAHAADFLRKAGQQIDDRDIAAGVKVMTSALLHAVGVDPEKVGNPRQKPGAKPPAKPAVKPGAAA